MLLTGVIGRLEAFQSTPPVWGATYQGQAYDFVAFDISIHAPRVGGDPSLSYTWRGSWTFQSTPPVWGATPICPSSICNISIHFNPRPPCGGRRAGAECGGTPAGISIHAPRVGGDLEVGFKVDSLHISIHAPRVGGDHPCAWCSPPYRYFNPRPPCGGRHTSVGEVLLRFEISIHAPRVGGDSIMAYRQLVKRDFNPRPPCGGRLGPPSDAQKSTLISIHAPRVGGDFSGIGNAIGSVIFQSTPPVWGATSPGQSRTYSRLFQSTPPVWGATAAPPRPRCPFHHFNPRPPCGGRPGF